MGSYKKKTSVFWAHLYSWISTNKIHFFRRWKDHEDVEKLKDIKKSNQIAKGVCLFAQDLTQQVQAS